MRAQLNPLSIIPPTSSHDAQPDGTANNTAHINYESQFPRSESVIIRDNFNDTDIGVLSSSVQNEYTFRQSLCGWSIRHNISHAALSDLLKTVLPKLEPGQVLPTCAKTLLRTPKESSVVRLAGGEYHYFGIKQSLLRLGSAGFHRKCDFPYLQKFVNLQNLLTLTISTDGLPLWKSSGTQLWPLLAVVNQCVDQTPFVIAIFSGESKPSNVELFLKDFVLEFKDLEQNGIVINSIHYSVRLSGIVADAPARSFIKSIKLHSGYNSCERCEDEGTYIDRMTFSTTSARLRTDASFQSKRDLEHHTGETPLIELDVSLVNNVVLDYMHLTCLGVMKKLLCLWCSGPLRTRLPARSIKEMSTLLDSLKSKFPSEFTRKPRTLKDLPRYKATELRTFLLYTGPSVLRGILPSHLFKHFLKFSVAMYILLSSNASDRSWNDRARLLLEEFVLEMKDFYGELRLVYNVHSLLHINNDALIYGSLDNMSAFPFESYMQKLKKLVRGKKLMVQQIIKRIHEINSNGLGLNSNAGSHPVRKASIGRNYYKKYPYKGIVVAVKDGDNCFLANDGKIIIVTRIFSKKSKMFVEYNYFYNKKPVLDYPIDSREMCIFKVTGKSCTYKCQLEAIRCKCILLPYRPGSASFLSIPMLS